MTPIERDWIPVKDAAERLLYSVDYFRRVFCDPKAPMLRLKVQLGGRIFVSAEDVAALEQGQLRVPKP